MNKNTTGNSPKIRTTNKPIMLNASNRNNASTSQKNVTPLNSSPHIEPKPKTVSIIGEHKNKSSSSSTPSSSFNNTTVPTKPVDNNPVSDTIVSNTTHYTSYGSQPISEHLIKSTVINTKTNINFATVTATESIPSREQAIVLNATDGIPQKEYVIAVGKIVKPINIIFVSRISNNRFCIFLSSKQVLENLLQHTQCININDQVIQIRRLINPAKRIIISNVCPSIPNLAILDALKNIDIIPTSQINHLKAGINLEGYEHIMSFRRQMYINHEDTPKLPNSLIINSNNNQLRIFFTDDTLTCFTCKSIGHTSNNCKKNSEIKLPDQPTINTNITNIHNNTSEIQPELSDNIQSSPNSKQKSMQERPNMDWSTETDHPLSIISNHDEEHISTPTQINTNKRPISDSSSSKPPDSPKNPITPIAPKIKEKTNKKAKIRSRSNSANRSHISLEKEPNSIEDYFSKNDQVPITYLQFIYILDNFTNKSINIHTLTEDVNIDISSLMDLIDQIRTLTSDRTLKGRLTKLSNLLFQAQPLQ